MIIARNLKKLGFEKVSRKEFHYQIGFVHKHLPSTSNTKLVVRKGWLYFVDIRKVSFYSRKVMTDRTTIDNYLQQLWTQPRFHINGVPFKHALEILQLAKEGKSLDEIMQVFLSRLEEKLNGQGVL